MGHIHVLLSSFHFIQDYGQFLSKDQITATMPPVAGAVDATLAWCTAKGFACNIVGTGDIIAAVAPVSSLATALKVRACVLACVRACVRVRVRVLYPLLACRFKEGWERGRQDNL